MSIRVNGVEITDEEVNVESAHYRGGSIPERWHRAAVALVLRELLRQRAEALGIPPAGGAGEDGGEDRRIEALIEREVAVPEADEAACRRYFEQNRERFRGEDLIEARHILLAVPPDDLAGRERARALAESLIAQLADEPGGFADLARRHSACPSRAQGGRLGQLARGATVPEFEEVLLRLPPGLARRPVETRYGWHVVEILHRVAGEPQPFEAVHERIARYLTERSRRRALNQYLRLLAGEAEIRGIELDAADSPLLQ